MLAVFLLFTTANGKSTTVLQRRGPYIHQQWTWVNRRSSVATPHNAVAVLERSVAVGNTRRDWHPSPSRRPQQSVVFRKQSVVFRKQSVVFRKKTVGRPQHAVGRRQQSVGRRKQSVGLRKQSVGDGNSRSVGGGSRSVGSGSRSVTMCS